MSRSEGLGHRHPTLLVSLIRLGNPQAPSLLAKLLASATEEEAEMALLRLSSVATSQRIWVLYELLENHSGALGQVLEHMRRSQRNFQFDRDLLREEARRLGLILPQEEDSPERNRKAA